MTKNRKLISRYNVELNIWETGYWEGNRFIILNTSKNVA